MTSTIDGLVSGMSTSDLINQLMQVEALPQTGLKNKVTAEQKVISAYQSVNARMVALQSAAEALTKPATWQGVKATVSAADAVTATAITGAAVGETTFDVARLAASQISTLTVSDAAAEVVTPAGLEITVGTGDPVPITVATNTVQGVADAINAKSGLGVRATVVTTESGSKVLQLSATKTGLANGFTVSGLAGAGGQVSTGLTTVAAAADARIVFGDTDGDGTPEAGGYVATSTTNTFSGVLPGVTFTVRKPATDVTISVQEDAAGLADKMEAMIAAANSGLSSINAQTAYNAATKSKAPLAGDFTVRQLAQNMLGTVGNGKSGYGSFKQLGVQLDRTGQLTFDRAAFLTAYQADPAKVQAAVAPVGNADAVPPVVAGLAGGLLAIAKSATDSTRGTLTTAVKAGNEKVRDLNGRITSWDVRLETRRTSLQRQFTNLEVSLGKLKDQSSWLAGQISSLPSGS